MTAIDRPLTDDERSVLLRLTIAAVVEQTGAAEQAAADALEDFAATGQAVITGDAEHARVDVCGHTLVTATRDWLAFAAIAASNEEQPS